MRAVLGLPLFFLLLVPSAPAGAVSIGFSESALSVTAGESFDLDIVVDGILDALDLPKQAA